MEKKEPIWCPECRRLMQPSCPRITIRPYEPIIKIPVHCEFCGYSAWIIYVAQTREERH